MNTTNDFSSKIAYREILRHITNAFAVLTMLYLMLETKSYLVHWTWSFLLPITWLSKINLILSNIGTLILLFPLTVILCAYLIPENRALKIGSSLFSASFGIYFLIQFLKNGWAIDTIKNMFFTVNYIPTFEQKLSVFNNEWKQLTNLNIVNSEARFQFLKTYIETNLNSVLKNQLCNTQLKFIPELANTEFVKANKLFDDSLKPGLVQNTANYMWESFKAHPFRVIGIVIISGVVITYCYQNNAINHVIDGCKTLSNSILRSQHAQEAATTTLAAGTLVATVQLAANAERTNDRFYDLISVIMYCFDSILETLQFEESTRKKIMGGLVNLAKAFMSDKNNPDNA